jgi:hypothetical protein
MLALADHADDEGRCYPSVARIAQRTGLSGRAVQTNIRSLIELGYIKVTIGGGKGNSNLYFISANPAAIAPDTLQEMHPAGNAPRSICTPNPAADAPNPAADAPEPSVTTKEPSEVSKTPAAICAILCEVHGVTVQAANSFIAYRRRSKAKALTETGATRLSSSLWKIFEQGGDPSDALGLAEERGWASVEPDWYFNTKGKSHDNRTQNNFGSTSGRGNRPDPALEQIARLTGLSPASGDDRVRVGGFGEKDGPLWMGTRPQ